MDKTSVYLDAEDRRMVARLASRERVSQAEIIRRAIRDYRPTGTTSRDFASARSFDGPGDSIADLDERELLAELGE